MLSEASARRITGAETDECGMKRLTCEAVARAGIGEPARRQGAELLWRCPRHDDRRPSLSVNPRKNCWMCGPCGASGGAWALAAFLAPVSADDKPAVKAWLREHGLLSGGKKGREMSTDKGRGPVVAEYVYHDADGNPVARKRR